jgi:predicted GIY-YIG superfamily endonuclease
MIQLFFVYIIESAATERRYYGATSDLATRLEHHNKGWNKSTKGRGPWKFIMTIQFFSWEEAHTCELKLKAMKNKSRIRKKFSEFFL